MQTSGYYRYIYDYDQPVIVDCSNLSLGMQSDVFLPLYHDSNLLALGKQDDR